MSEVEKGYQPSKSESAMAQWKMSDEQNELSYRREEVSNLRQEFGMDCENYIKYLTEKDCNDLDKMAVIE